MTYRLPEPLADRHDTEEFSCRSAEQTEWLRRYARQSAATGTTQPVALLARLGVHVDHEGHGLGAGLM